MILVQKNELYIYNIEINVSTAQFQQELGLYYGRISGNLPPQKQLDDHSICEIRLFN